MAGGAFFARGLVEEHWLAAYRLHVLVTAVTANFLVRSLQGECRAFMIEKRRLPFETVMAICARRDLVGIRELQSVHILVALFALCRRCLEIRLH